MALRNTLSQSRILSSNGSIENLPAPLFELARVTISHYVEDQVSTLREPIRQLEHLYAFTDWRIVLTDERLNKAYQEFSTLSMFKALALPYLIDIPTERALARELAEREPLQALCGFLPGNTPTRPTFWHFRNTKYLDVFPDVMLRVLIAMVLGTEQPNLDLPFVAPVSQTEMPPDGHYSTFKLDLYRPPIEIWTIGANIAFDPPIITVGKAMEELRREEQ